MEQFSAVSIVMPFLFHFLNCEFVYIHIIRLINFEKTLRFVYDIKSFKRYIRRWSLYLLFYSFMIMVLCREPYYSCVHFQ